MKTKRKNLILALILAVVAIANIVILAAVFIPGSSGQEDPPTASESDVPMQPLDDVDMQQPSGYEKYEIGDILLFGTIEQDGDESTTDEPIEWIVIDKNENGIFVISRYGLMPVQFHWNNTRYPKHITWEESNIRHWLNNEFYMQCFSPEEREYIALTYIVNEDSSKYTTKGGNDTYDYIFFLSHSETEKYFPSSADKRLEPTKAAVEAGAYVKKNECFWWLRTPGKYQCNAEYVFTGGSIYAYGSDVGHDNVCARPAMWISF